MIHASVLRGACYDLITVSIVGFLLTFSCSTTTTTTASKTVAFALSFTSAPPRKLLPISGRHVSSSVPSKTALSVSAESSPTSSFSSSTPSQLGGTAEFEQWYASKCKQLSKSDKENNTLDMVKHAIFPNGRGLQFLKDSNIEVDEAVITLPKELVLRSRFIKRSEDDEEKMTDKELAEEWDTVLAVKLLRECRLGKKSDFYGYCSLLTRGQDFMQCAPCPPSIAPDALRNWTPSQKEYLVEVGANAQKNKNSNINRGEKLLSIANQQLQSWTRKYIALPQSDRRAFTQEQFVWAMEAVHSRAFIGNFGDGTFLQRASSFLLPVAATAFASNYYLTDPVKTDDRITLLLGLIAFSPLALNYFNNVSGEGEMDAVLLPFIDSANHLQEARSNIEYDPVKGVFVLTIAGRNCLAEDNENAKMRQLMISYGVKRDTELLLNYGFLPGVVESTLTVNDDDGERDALRRALANKFATKRS